MYHQELYRRTPHLTEGNGARDTIKDQGRRAPQSTKRKTMAANNSATGTKAAFIRELTT
jgi:hypothetical protein